MRVGCVQINAEFSGQCYLPYSAGILQAYARRHLRSPQVYQFLLPVFRRDKVADAVAHLDSADIVGFSVYSWNERLSMAMAEALKRKRPSTLIVCGGPQVPRHDWPWEIEAFHRRYPFIDLAVHGAGEQAFVEILERGRDGRWETLPSVSFLNERDVLVQTARSPALKDLTEVPEPDLEGIFDALMAEHPKLDWIGIEETNRNCPFQCTFCGWGLLGSKPICAPGGSAAHDRLVRRSQDWLRLRGRFELRNVQGARHRDRAILRTGQARARLSTIRERAGREEHRAVGGSRA